MLRTASSILLLLVFGLLSLAPLLALGQSDDGSLPACCRRNGAHHCAMRMTERMGADAVGSHGPRWKAPNERCPYCPASVAGTHSHDTFGALERDVAAMENFSHPTGTVQTDSKLRIARDRSRQKRGPPSFPG